MTVRTIKIYTIENHPCRELVYDWVRQNWLELNSHSVTEIASALRAVASRLGLVADYSLSTIPCNTDFVSLTVDYSNAKLVEYYKVALEELREEYTASGQGMLLTGTYWDGIIIDNLLKDENPALENDLLSALYADTEYLYSGAGLYDHLQANQYFFNSEGKFVPQ